LRLEERLDHLEVTFNQRLNELSQRITSLEEKIDRRFESIEKRFYWVIGLIFLSWLTLFVAILLKK